MSVVVTPDAGSPVLDALDVVAVAPTPAEGVTTWRDADADALVVDSGDERLVASVRDEPDGAAVPIVLVTSAAHPEAHADAVLSPDADADEATDAVQRAVTARDYRDAVTALYEACRDRTFGHPDDRILELRAAADRAYERLDEIPPSILHASPDRQP